MQIRIGDRVVECELVNGVPTVVARAEEVRHPDGRVDVVMHVPCLDIAAKED